MAITRTQQARQMYKKGKSVKKGYHRTKDGRMAKKGLYY